MPNEKLTQLQRAMIEHDDDMARLDRNTIPITESITVESCLAELREMMPDKVIFIQDNVQWWADDADPCRATTISIDYPPDNQKKFTDDSLSKCIAQVRAWHKAQDLNTVLPQGRSR